MDAALLALYVALPILTWIRVRSLAWTVIAIAGAGAAAGAMVNFVIDRGVDLTRVQLQIILLAVLGAVFVLALVRPWRGKVPVSRQVLAVLLPSGLLLAGFLIITMRWTEEFAFLRPVSFLIGQATAEDNSKWLDFTAQWAAGGGIDQPVPLGGPLQLYLTFVGTLMAVISQVALGGFNEVAVAANSVVYGQFGLAMLMPFAFAPMAEAKFASRSSVGGSAGARGRVPRGFIPLPGLWIGMLVLVVVSLAVVAYGHLTLQFTFLIAGLWVATFLSGSRVPRARLVTSLAAAASMTVWLPLNVIAIIIVVTWLALYVSRLVRFGAGAVDWWGAALLIVVAVGVFQPVWSSMVYLLFASSGAAVPALGAGVGALGSGIGVGSAAGASLPSVPALADSILFAATGGTESAGPLLMGAAFISALAASVVITRQPVGNRLAAYRSFAPLGVFVFIAMSIYVLDAYATGSAPNYGSMKFTFMVVSIALATTLPIAVLALDPGAGFGMTVSRWIVVAGVVVLLAVDSLLPRAIAQVRQDNWSPPIPFNNTSGSYWYPAEVNGRGDQPIESNPIACVYMPEGYPVPTAIVPSGLSDAQRVYACTRQLAGLGGLDAEAQPVVDWLRREWLSNTPAWSAVYDGLAGLSDEVLDRPVILLDDGSNVKGVESLRSLLTRFPKDAAGV